MSESKTKSWPTLGFISNGDTGPYLALKEGVKVKVNGKEVSGKYLSIPKFITYYDKELGEEIVVGKLVKRKKDDKIVEYVQFEDNVEFGNSEGKLKTSGFGSLRSKKDRLANIEKLEKDGTLTGDKAAKAREVVGYSLFQVDLPPPRD